MPKKQKYSYRKELKRLRPKLERANEFIECFKYKVDRQNVTVSDKDETLAVLIDCYRQMQVCLGHVKREPEKEKSSTSQHTENETDPKQPKPPKVALPEEVNVNNYDEYTATDVAGEPEEDQNRVDIPQVERNMIRQNKQDLQILINGIRLFAAIDMEEFRKRLQKRRHPNSRVRRNSDELDSAHTTNQFAADFFQKFMANENLAKNTSREAQRILVQRLNTSGESIRSTIKYLDDLLEEVSFWARAVRFSEAVVMLAAFLSATLGVLIPGEIAAITTLVLTVANGVLDTIENTFFKKHERNQKQAKRQNNLNLEQG